MSPRYLTLIVAMSLTLVIIVTQTVLLGSFSNHSQSQEREKQSALEIPRKEQVRIDETLDLVAIENIEDIENEQEVFEEETSINEQNIEGARAQVETTPRATRENKQLNKQTNNTNILCLGVDQNKLEMISIYSINKGNKKSAGIFLPTRTSLRINGQLLTLADIYHNHGVLTLKKALSQSLLIDIPYHMVADKKGLEELSDLIGPLYVENEEIDIPNLFVRPVSDKDDEILQSLASEVTQPKMVLQVPRLIRIFINNVKSDIGVNGLWDLYGVFRNLDHSELSKIILWGQNVKMAGSSYWFIDPYDWHNVVYDMTK